jgi:hypothetical protein
MRKSVTLNKFFNIAEISGLLLFSACVFLPPEEGEDVAITVFLIIVSLFLIICTVIYQRAYGQKDSFKSIGTAKLPKNLISVTESANRHRCLF